MAENSGGLILPDKAEGVSELCLKVDSWDTVVGRLKSDVDKGPPCPAVSPAGVVCRKTDALHWCEATAETLELFWGGLRLIEDPYVGEPFELISWFREWLFNSLTIRRWNDGKTLWERHFRVGYIIIPKGNMKSTGLAGLTQYFLATLPPGSYGCITAQDLDKAMTNIRRIIDVMIEMSPVMQGFDIKWIARANQWVRYTPGLPDVIIQVVSPRNFDSKRGPRTRFTVIDEFAFVADMHEFWNVVRKAWYIQPEPFAAMSSTPNKDPLSWERQTTERMLERLDNPRFMPRWLPTMFMAGEEDDLDDPANWLKWNPAIQEGIGDIQILHDEFDESEGDPASRNDFYCDRCAFPRDTTANFISKPEWEACASSNGMAWVRERMSELPQWVAFDLSETSDLCAMCKVAVDEELGVLYVDAYGWVPSSITRDLNKKLSGKVDEWLDDESVPLFELPAGKSLGTDVAEHSLRLLAGEDKIMYIGYDYRSATEAAAIWREEFYGKAEVKHVAQGFGLNESIKLTRQLVKDGKLVHGGNPVLDYCVLGADIKADVHGNYMIVKHDRNLTHVRVDLAVAMVTAIQARKAWRHYESMNPQPSLPSGNVISY